MNEYGWNWAAKVVEEEFGGYVNWDEEYFICPECGEPVSSEDWDDTDFALATICPICELNENDRKKNMKLKDKINHYIDADPMGPILIPLGMLAAALIFLIMATCVWECYDNWYNDTYVTEVSRSEPADGIVTEYGTRTEHGYKTIYDDRRVWSGKAYVTKRVRVGSEPYDIIHKYIKYAVYSNIDDLYHESGWREVGCKMKPGYVYGKFQVVTYYDSHKDKTWTELEKYVGG